MLGGLAETEIARAIVQAHLTPGSVRYTISPVRGSAVSGLLAVDTGSPADGLIQSLPCTPTTHHPSWRPNYRILWQCKSTEAELFEGCAAFVPEVIAILLVDRKE